jgi:hypothetical protein
VFLCEHSLDGGEVSSGRFSGHQAATGFGLSRAAHGGLIGDDLAILWVQNLQHTLANVVEKKPIPPVTGARIVLAGVPVKQRCAIEWWDTSKGEVTRTQEAVVTSEVLSLDLPDLAEDVALKVRW